jgi:8-hydroxy-5-deazaflavin:NADPH oxidoreductase
MKIGIIGGGAVGQALGGKLQSTGHSVALGIRDPSDTELDRARNFALPLRDWAATTGARVTTMPAAAAHGEIVINATAGMQSLAALMLAGAENLAGKILIDVANPLNFSRGMPPYLDPALSGPTSLGEEIQKAFPDTQVVKALNTISNAVMIDPAQIPADHDLFIAGNSDAAKASVKALLTSAFGWTSFVDLGDIVGARGTEALLPIWIRLWGVNQTPLFNLKMVRA